MSCLPTCGLRLWRRKRAPPADAQKEKEEHARPYSGATVVATSTGVDTLAVEKAGQRSRSRSVGQRLAVPVGAFSSALRARSRSRSNLPALQPRKPSATDKQLPSLPVVDAAAAAAAAKRPRSSSSLDDEKPPRPSVDDDDEEEEEEPRTQVSEKPPRLELDLVTVRGPAWSLYDEKKVEGSSGLKNRLSTAKRVDSGDDWLDTPVSPLSPDSPAEEKRQAAKRDSTAKGDPNRDSKMKDQLPVEVKETDEERRLRKMAEARQRQVEHDRDEQERLDMFQLM